MSSGEACRNPEHRPTWRVTALRCNYSAFNGYKRTPSAYSEVTCDTCGHRWRTTAAYVDELVARDAARESEQKVDVGTAMVRLRESTARLEAEEQAEREAGR